MSKNYFFTFLLVSLLLPALVLEASDLLMIANFNQGNQNALGGYFNKFERDTSKASVGLTNSIYRGEAGKSLEIKAKKGPDGYCGAWIHLFDFRADTKQYLDASAYKYLSFWVKGKKGGEKFSVKLADKRLIEIEDSVSVGDINQFLLNGVTQEWQEVLIPIGRLNNVKINQLGGVTFDFDQQGNYTVYIDDITLKKTRSARIIPVDSTKSKTKAEVTQQSTPPRTLWVWTIFEILENKNNEQNILFDACTRENVDRLWVQIPTQYEPGIDLSADLKTIKPAEFKVSLLHEDKLRAFIRKAHEKNITIEGLDGYPEFSQKPYHFIPLAIVDAIIDYNNRVDPKERFDGVHFDNEPYLIIGWHDRKRREQILREFLELNIECQRRIRENSDMVYGIDVPFWWNTADPSGDGDIGDVTFNGERKPAVYFCIDLLDNIGIMNYRDTTYGVDGIIAHASPILNYAEKVGKNDIYVGLEVFRYVPVDVLFPLGLPHDAFYDALQSDTNKFGYLSRINGYRTQVIDDGVSVHVGIELPPSPDEAAQKKIDATILEMSHHLGIKWRQGLSSLDYKKAITHVQKEINANPEWSGYKPSKIKDPQTQEEYPVFKSVRIMLGKTTFADESYDEFKSQLKQAENELVNNPAFKGIAIHYFNVLNEKFYESKAESEATATGNPECE